MKTKITFIMLLCTLFTFAQNEFISIWKPTNPSKPGTGTTSTQISLPVFGANYSVVWEEVGYPAHNGILSNQISASIINFGVPSNPVATNATYLVKVTAANVALNFFYSDIGDNEKIIKITQWGTNVWSNLELAFSNCKNMDVTAVDVPNLSNITSLRQMFVDCSSLQGNSSFNNWNTSNITDISGMFWGTTLFNQNIGLWNTGNVTTINTMFLNATAFNQNIGSWNTANVTNMGFAFLGAKAFNQNIGSWNTIKVTAMGNMFSGASAFNQNIGSWNTVNVTSMGSMFSNASAFNQSLVNWNTAKVTNMQSMFAGANAFNQSLGNWNLIAAPNMTGMLTGSGMNCVNYDSTLIGWSNNTNTPNNITFGASGRVYSSTAAQAARNILITQKSWVISGDSFDGTCAALGDENFVTLNTKIYPNPAQNIVNVEVDGLTEIEVYDINGRFLIKKQMSENKNSMDISSLSKGIYILKVSTGNGIGNFKIIKE